MIFCGSRYNLLFIFIVLFFFLLLKALSQSCAWECERQSSEQAVKVRICMYVCTYVRLYMKVYKNLKLLFAHVKKPLLKRYAHLGTICELCILPLGGSIYIQNWIIKPRVAYKLFLKKVS